ncbi:hypothetical protein [Rhizobium yanglingense]
MRELSNYRTKGQLEAKQRIIQVGADLSRDAAGQIPGLSNIVSIFDAVQHAKEGVATGWEMLILRDTQKALVEGAKKRRDKHECQPSTRSMPAKAANRSCSTVSRL